MYGLRAASLHYFYRQPENLRPEQAAMLAGLLQAPSRLAPTRNPDLAAERFRLVKGAMVAAGYITQDKASTMPVPTLDVRTRNDLPTGTYFADWALPTAREQSDMTYSRQTITTTLDSELQAAANRVIQRAPLGSAQVALVAMRPNGEVVAMVGGKDYAASPFNRVTQARRQPGSTFKLFVYLAALRNGWSPDDTISNTEFTEGSYQPSNASGRYSETITLREAFAQSSNVAAVRLFNEVGSEAVIETARELGVSSELPEGDPSMALGTSTMSLLELTAAYAGVAGNSFPVEPHAFAAAEQGWFDWLLDGRGNLGSSDQKDIEDMLRGAINAGTGPRGDALAFPITARPAPSQDNRDALFVGYAGEGENRLVVGVWIGNDDNSPLGNISGGGLPARIWRDFMRAALGASAAPPRPTPSPDPSGPVQPQDVPDLQDIPLGDGRRLIINDNEAVLSTDIEGVPLEVRVRDGEFSLELDEARAQRELGAQQWARKCPAQVPASSAVRRDEVFLARRHLRVVHHRVLRQHPFQIDPGLVGTGEGGGQPVVHALAQAPSSSACRSFAGRASAASPKRSSQSHSWASGSWAPVPAGRRCTSSSAGWSRSGCIRSSSSRHPLHRAQAWCRSSSRRRSGSKPR